MKCPKCGNEVPEDSIFCLKCGEKLIGGNEKQEVAEKTSESAEEEPEGGTENSDRGAVQKKKSPGKGKLLAAAAAGIVLIVCGVLMFNNIQQKNKINTYQSLIEAAGYGDAQELYNANKENAGFMEKTGKWLKEYVNEKLVQDPAVAVDVLNSDLVTDEAFSEGVYQKIESEIDTVINETKEKQENYETAIQTLNFYKNLKRPGMSLKISEGIRQLEALQNSNLSYLEALEKAENGEVFEAASIFKKVLKNDVNYENSKTELSKLESEAVSLLRQEVNGYLSEKAYDKALESVGRGLELFTGNSELGELRGEINAQKFAEQKALREQEIQQHIEELRNTIRVKKCYSGRPNSAGGVSLYITYVNMSDTKVIKYADFSCVPYNSVDDPVRCEIRRRSEFTARDNGPYKKGEGNLSTNWYWENAWYNSTITYVKLTNIRIEYMDGSTYTIGADEISYVFE